MNTWPMPMTHHLMTQVTKYPAATRPCDLGVCQQLLACPAMLCAHFRCSFLRHSDTETYGNYCCKTCFDWEHCKRPSRRTLKHGKTLRSSQVFSTQLVSACHSRDIEIQGPRNFHISQGPRNPGPLTGTDWSSHRRASSVLGAPPRRCEGRLPEEGRELERAEPGVPRGSAPVKARAERRWKR